MKKSILSCRSTFVFLLAFISPSIGFAKTTSCAELLSAVHGDYMSYVNKAEAARGNFKDKHPEFLNPESEKKLVELWKGELGPEALQALLPPGVTFVSHQLRKAASPGVVKVEQKSGDFLILRVEMPFNGKTISTNVTVNAQALFQNLARSLRGEPLWLIGPEATAAMDWGHGGGTKTTGGHTADTLMNYMSKYNVFTVGMDQPWHGEGPRVWFENDEEYFAFRVAFRDRFIHPDVPTFLVGHSKGGLVADMALRRTGSKYAHIGLNRAYAGMIPLSFVPDPFPEEDDFEKRTTKERVKDMEQKEEEIMARINPGDCSLFANLMSEDKISALSGLKCTQLGLYNRWNEQTDVSLPSLYVMGEHDGLYILSEKNIEKYVRSLPQASLWTYSSRVSFRGEVEPVGHMIFDHYMPKKNHPEAVSAIEDYLLSKKWIEKGSGEDVLQRVFKEKVLKGAVNEFSFLTEVNNYSSTLALMGYQWVPDFKAFLESRISELAEEKGEKVEAFQPKYFLEYTEGVFETYQIIRDFMARVLAQRGVELHEISAQQRKQESQKEGDILANQRDSILGLLKAYGNNLAFREFLKDFSYYDMGATKEFEELNRLSGELTHRLKILSSIKKEKITEEEKAEKVAELPPLTDELGNVLEPGDGLSIQASLDRIHKIRNKNWVPEGELREFAERNIEERTHNHTLMKELEGQRDQLRKNYESLKSEVSLVESKFEAAYRGKSSPALADYEARRSKLYNELETYDLKVRDVQEAFMVEVLKSKGSLAAAFSQLPETLLETYQAAESASQRYQALLKEGEDIVETEALSGALGPEVQELANVLIGPSGLRAQSAEAFLAYMQVEYEAYSQAKDHQEELLKEYVDRVMPQYFKVRTVKVIDALNAPIGDMEEAKEAFKFAAKALSHWRNKILLSKPEGGDSSLY